MAYADPNFVPALYLFSSGASSLALTSAVAFNCYNNTLDNLTRLANSSTVVLPSPEAIEDLSWYTDSGVSTHVTNNLGILLNLQSYKGSKQLLVGDGNGLQITHMGSAKLDTLSVNNSIMLHHVLHVPYITVDAL